MSTHHEPHSHDDNMPRVEPWLAVMASSVVPTIVALYIHARFVTALIGATVMLFLASLVMLRRQVVQNRRARQQASTHRELEAL